MKAASRIDVGTRLEINELLSLYCHLVDANDAEAWAKLFAPDAVFEIQGLMRLEGRDQLKAMPGIVHKQGRGLWRHQITNVVVTPGLRDDELLASAYGLVTDWSKGGQPSSFTNYRVSFRGPEPWRIAQLNATVLMPAAAAGDA